MPRHPVALELLRAAGVPIAAPSANRFTQMSPTTAEHVREAFGAETPFLLDGGPCEVGLESTVIAVTRGGLEVLRPGMAEVGQTRLLRPLARARRIDLRASSASITARRLGSCL